jgi:Cys-tRNA(Pro)/Cys-tRNA(Cys) deacylase
VDVHNYLIEHEVHHEVVATQGRLRSPERIAAVLDLSPREVGRVVIYETPSSPVAAVLPSDAEPDPRRIQQAVGAESLDAVTDHRASELTGYLPEAIPPAGLPGRLVVVVDHSFDSDEVLYFPGGEARAILKIRGKDLIRATGGRVAAISRRRAGPRAP